MEAEYHKTVKFAESVKWAKASCNKNSKEDPIAQHYGITTQEAMDCETARQGKLAQNMTMQEGVEILKSVRKLKLQIKRDQRAFNLAKEKNPDITWKEMFGVDGPTSCMSVLTGEKGNICTLVNSNSILELSGQTMVDLLQGGQFGQ